MVLDKYRNISDRLLEPFARPMRQINPNYLSVAALALAVLAGLFFWLSNFCKAALISASLLVFMSSFFDALDGRVAKIAKKETKKGDFLDHVLDRYADVFILGGIMLSPYCNPVIGALAIIGVLLASYLGTQAQALGLGREYRGILGRADRLVILIVVPITQFLILERIWYFYAVEWMMIYFAILGNVTALQRAWHSWRKLK
ncbi:MAG: CDP-alcohol phosphatidyltransferase family protein [Candidatus Thermoplasmatota archaeon]|nr:CDP-alcohol phosphatidyltransferase family protein [Candidatus Thermoplasmatota archaeon]MDI6887848.1 CDP-alcohol phosphatidyltransferase family protein [Candidatus Thermoplasmatota archaeon]